MQLIPSSVKKTSSASIDFALRIIALEAPEQFPKVWALLKLPQRPLITGPNSSLFFSRDARVDSFMRSKLEDLSETHTSYRQQMNFGSH